MSYKSDILDLHVIVHRQTGSAILVSEDSNLARAVWLPLSQIEFDEKPSTDGMRHAELQIPEWLAKSKGLA